MKREIFKFKKVNFGKLEEFGFQKSGDVYIYSNFINAGEFTFSCKIFKNGDIYTEIIDNASNEEYTLHNIADADGVFVGHIKEEYEKLISKISEKCLDSEIFKSEYTHKVIDYAQKKYFDSPEYLWAKFPNNAIIRRQDSQKWYAVIMTIPKNKLGFDDNNEVEVINLHVAPEYVPNLLIQDTIYPAYHMNKKHWITIILDGSLPIEKIFKMLDNSYDLARK